jgi:serine/threonine protein kinase
VFYFSSSSCFVLSVCLLYLCHRSTYRLCGYPPFYADNAPALFKKIMDVQYDFDDPSWDEVSEEAKNLIQQLLVKEPGDRLTAQQVLENPWVTGDKASNKMIQTGKLKETVDREKGNA